MIDKINGNGVYYSDQKKKKNPAVRAYENTPGTKEAAQKKAAGPHKKRTAGAAGSSESGVILDLSAKTARGKEQVRGQKKENFWTDAVRKLFAPVLQWIRAFWESDSLKAETKGAEGAAAADQSETAQRTQVQGSEVQETEKLASDTGNQLADVQGMEAGMPDDGVQGMEAGMPDDGVQGMEAGMPDNGVQGMKAQKTDADTQKVQTEAAQEIEGLGGLDLDETVLPPLDALEEEMDLKAVRDAAVKSGSIQKIEQFVTQNGTKHLAHNSDLLTYYDRRGKIVELDETEKHRVLFGDKNVLKL